MGLWCLVWVPGSGDVREVPSGALRIPLGTGGGLVYLFFSARV